MTKTGPGSRLERALEVFLAEAPKSPAEAATLLSQHDDLRDLLEPMLSGTEESSEPGEDQVLGDFRLVRELGRGGMGIVYEAWQRSLDRRVAVKVLSPALVGSPAAVARFRREAAAAGRLRHSNVVEVYGFGSANGQHFFAMQLVDGVPLHSCKTDFRDPHRAVDLITAVVDALVHAHAAGLVHRDVKPANVLVRPDGTPLLTDFGVASDKALPSLTREGSFIGTLDYASPEQVRGEATDARTDVWAIGVMLCELLTGKHPFTAATQEATIRNILTAEPPSLRGHERISRDLAAVIGRALELHPARRYASAAALRADLQALQHGAAVSARLPTVNDRLLRWLRREPWRALATGVVLVAVPALAGTLGYLAANAGRIEAATTAERLRAREEVLARAWWQLHEGLAEAGLRTLQKLPAADDAEVAVTRASLLHQLKRAPDALAALQPFPGETIDLVRAFINDRTLPIHDDHDLSAFDCAVRAELLLGDATREGAAVHGLLRQSIAMANLAIALAPTPRLAHWVTLGDAAIKLDDRSLTALVERALAQHFPDSNVARRVRARALSRSQPEMCLALLADLQPDETWAGSVWSIRGVAYENLGRFDDALAAHREVLKIRPDDSRAWANIGAVLRKQKNYEDSAAALRRAIAAQPKDAFTWNLLGLTLRSDGQPVEAKQALEQALALRPDYAAAAYNLGNLLVTTGDLPGAISAFERAVAADPEDVRSLANLGDALVRAGRPQTALPIFMRSTQLAPGDLIPHFNLARTALELGLPELALPAAKRADEIDAKGYHGAWVHADALLAQPTIDAAAALACAHRAADRSRQAVLAVQLALARALAASGDAGAAIRVLEAAQQEPKFATSSDLPELETMLARLRKRP